MPKKTDRLQQPDLLEAIHKRGWTQEEAGVFLGISGPRVSQLINYRQIPHEFSAELEIRMYELTGKMSEELFPRSIRGREDFLAGDKTTDSPEDLAKLTSFRLANYGLAWDQEPLDDVVFRGELRTRINEVLSRLTPREQQVLRLRFGLTDNGSEVSLEEVGKQFGVTRERIRCIEARALAKLRHPKFGGPLKATLNLPRR